jgi:hypothetical protein
LYSDRITTRQPLNEHSFNLRWKSRSGTLLFVLGAVSANVAGSV